ncbi:aldo/keto reductase [Pararhizobium mangrovi]|nr:aldo/keto reductase [Pararhizobium mangrovi]
MRTDGAVFPRLGFGCSALMGRLGLAASQRIVDAAFDAGITHFDTARAYGYGEAERALAGLLSRNRAAITVTTKVGILPPRRSPLISAARGAARFTVGMVPGSRALLRRGAAATVRHGAFGIDSLRASFETSLGELSIDAVDCLLAHDCDAADLADGEVRAFLEEQKAKGRTGMIGTATGVEQTRNCLTVWPDTFDVVQFGSDAASRASAKVERPANTHTITHSAITGILPGILEKLDRDEAERRRWSRTLGIDVDDSRALGLVLLRHALDANPNGTVLFSSTNIETIQRSTRLLAEDLVTAEQAQVLEGLIAEWRGP